MRIHTLCVTEVCTLKCLKQICGVCVCVRPSARQMFVLWSSLPGVTLLRLSCETFPNPSLLMSGIWLENVIEPQEIKSRIQDGGGLVMNRPLHVPDAPGDCHTLRQKLFTLCVFEFWPSVFSVLAGAGASLSEGLQCGRVLRRRRRLLAVQRIRAVPWGPAESVHEHAHQDKTRAVGLDRRSGPLPLTRTTQTHTRTLQRSAYNRGNVF